MQVKKTSVIYFSPSGTTKKVAEKISGGFEGNREYHDILAHRIEKKLNVAEDGLLILAMPVFGGRIPEYCLSSIKHLRGLNTPAIIVAVYGNREYEDALIEMQDMVDEVGFCVIGAGAFVAQHSVFNHVAAGRPDEADMEKLDIFVRQCKEKLTGFDPENYVKLELPGNRPYKTHMKPSLFPEADKNCTKCRTCVKVCPVHAINSETPRKTDKKKCMMCTACIASCPVKARSFGGPKYAIASKTFASACGKRKEPEIYV